MFVLLGGEEWREWKLPLSLSVRSEFTRRMDNSAAVQTIWQICWILLTGTKSSCEKKEKPLPDGMTMSGGGEEVEGTREGAPSVPPSPPFERKPRGNDRKVFTQVYTLSEREKTHRSSANKNTLSWSGSFFCFVFLLWIDLFIRGSEESVVMISVESVERINHKQINIKM